MIYKDIRIKIPWQVEYTISELQSNGYKAYIVGGSVRDSILHREIHDYDITTNAFPEDVTDIFTFNGNKVIPTGFMHGTVTVLVKDMPIEITTFRIDGKYSDNRTPDIVTFISSLKEDLSRRDLTINAMAYNSKEGLIDYFGGLDDIKNRIIRCVGNANTRFNEDALRMMRCIRFAAQLDFHIEDDTAKAIQLNDKLLNNISRERIHDELNKILVSNHPEYIAHMYYYEILDDIIPEYADCFECAQNNPYHIYNVGEHIKESMINVENNLILRLTMLFHDIGKPLCKTTDDKGIDHFYGHAEKSSGIAYDIMKRLKYDNNTIEKVCLLIKHHDTKIESDKTIKRLLNRLGKENMYNFLKVREADIKAQNLKYYNKRHEKILRIKNRLDEIIRENECFNLKDLAINGNDLIKLGYQQGKQIGEILNYLLEKVVDDSSLNNREDLIKLVNGSEIK